MLGLRRRMQGMRSLRHSVDLRRAANGMLPDIERFVNKILANVKEFANIELAKAKERSSVAKMVALFFNCNRSYF